MERDLPREAFIAQLRGWIAEAQAANHAYQEAQERESQQAKAHADRVRGQLEATQDAIEHAGIEEIVCTTEQRGELGDLYIFTVEGIEPKRSLTLAVTDSGTLHWRLLRQEPRRYASGELPIDDTTAGTIDRAFQVLIDQRYWADEAIPTLGPVDEH